MSRLRKRAQSEAVGLLVIVIILIFMGFIYLRFSLHGNSNDYESVRQSIEAHGLLRALLQLDVKGENFEDGVSACYYDAAACIALEQQIKSAYNAALGADEDYKLTIIGEEKQLLDVGGCEDGIVSRVPFTVEGVFYEGKLILCRKV